MVKCSKVNRGYKYIFTNIDIFSKFAWSFPLKTKTIKEIKSCFQKIFKERRPLYIWSDQESAIRYHHTIKMKPIDVNKSNEKHIKNTVYNYDITNKKPKYKINDLVRISLKRR